MPPDTDAVSVSVWPTATEGFCGEIVGVVKLGTIVVVACAAAFNWLIESTLGKLALIIRIVAMKKAEITRPYSNLCIKMLRSDLSTWFPIYYP